MEEIQIKLIFQWKIWLSTIDCQKKVARIAEKVTLSEEGLENRCDKEGVNKPRLVECSSFEDN